MSNLAKASALEAKAAGIRMKASGGNDKLAAMMRKRGESDYTLASAVGVSSVAVYHWRHGRNKPRSMMAGFVCAVLQCTRKQAGL